MVDDLDAKTVPNSLIARALSYEGGSGEQDEDKSTKARERIKAAQNVLALEQYAMIETVAGWNCTAGNIRKLMLLRAGLDELFRTGL